MEVSYRRDLNHNYMILEEEGLQGNEYPIRMMEQNQIPELLPLRLRKVNGKTFLYYEITSRQPLSQVYETVSMGSREIEQLLIGIRNSIERAHQYLLNSEDLLLEPEYIYMNMGTGNIQLCCVPMRKIREENPFLKLSEFILKNLDHGDRRAVHLGYEFFSQVSQENFSFQECLKELLEENKVFRLEERDEEEKWFENKYVEKEEKEREWEKEREQRSEKRGEWNGRKWGAENRRDQETDKGTGREKNRRKDRESGEEKRGEAGTHKKKDVLLCLLIIFLILLVFAGIVYFGRLDLTQTGGLAFLFLAVIWILSGILQSRKQTKKKYWLEDEEDTEEEAWMETMLADIYDRDAADTERRSKDRSDTDLYCSSGSKKAEIIRNTKEPEDICGETRCLTELEYEPELRLISQSRSRYPDLELRKEKAVIGKKKEQADLWLSQDCISRIHARLEHRKDGYYLTDLNSMNGTFVNGERLRPNEMRQIYAGDKISFATLRYIVKD